MKKIILKITRTTVVLMSITLVISSGSCVKDLLNQQPTTELGAAAYWQTEDDAVSALMGAYSSIRPCFDRDYYFDGQGEFVKVRGTSAESGNLRLGDAYSVGSSGFTPSGYGNQFDKMYRYLYGGINRANYVIDNVREMLPSAKSPESKTKLEAVIGEARLLRGMVYFRLIAMWGDVPYIGNTVYHNSEVDNIKRTPIIQIKDSIIADFTYALEKLPAKSSQVGRAAKPAALAFRGKMYLYWACWNKFGWPELESLHEAGYSERFVPSQAEAQTAYTNAAADFKSVIDGYGLTLFRNGDPGNWGIMGDAETLPNYFYLSIPAANNSQEFIMAFTHGGTGTSQGEELMRDVGGRNHENAQCWMSPYFEVADRYQSTVTGDFCPKLIPMNPSTALDARTATNSALNPESYAGRDYRMKGTLMWDYEKCLSMSGLVSTGMVPFIYKTWGATVTIDGTKYTSWNPANTAATNGYAFRKFLRNYAGQARNDGDYSWPVMRLADVYLMYAESSNEAYGPLADAVEAVNKVRRRGNLPALAAEKTDSKEHFFDAIEQERIIELLAEGHRGFDLRRWRAIERVWGAPYSAGVWRIDTWGANITRYFQNSAELVYQQCYIFKIPASERERNPNLTQNVPWL